MVSRHSPTEEEVAGGKGLGRKTASALGRRPGRAEEQEGSRATGRHAAPETWESGLQTEHPEKEVPAHSRPVCAPRIDMTPHSASRGV